MASNADLPPTQTIIPIDTPPDSDRPTAAMLKADVDSGATGDKTEVFDPGMAMLGTCEEAAGTPLKPELIALARRYETIQRWMKGSRKAGGAHHRQDGFPVAFVGFIALLAVVFVGAIAMT